MLSGMRARLATVDDIDELIRHRAGMLEEIGTPLHDDSAWRASCAVMLQAELGGRIFAAVVPHGDRAGLAASGTVCEVTKLPHPLNPSGTVGYLQSMWCDVEARRHGHARAVMAALLAEAERRGLARLELHASDVGRPLYESLGFEPRTWHPEMTMNL
jgi:ribosomal protein S18 acetylase RimI-like enzyme